MMRISYIRSEKKNSKDNNFIIFQNNSFSKSSKNKLLTKEFVNKTIHNICVFLSLNPVLNFVENFRKTHSDPEIQRS